jgi:spore maturation protein CgeB
MADALESAAAVVIGPDYLDAFASNIAAGLRSWGITTAVIDPNAGFIRPGTMDAYSPYGAVMGEVIRRMPRAQRLLIDRPIERALRQSAPTLVISVWSQFTPRQIERWRTLTPNATWVFWYPDHLANLGAHRVLLAPYDHLFFKEPHLVDVLSSRTRLRVHMLAQACNPDHHHTETPVSEEERRRYDCDVAVAGNLYPYRLLVMAGIPNDVTLHIYGNPRIGAPPGFDRIARAITREYVAGRTKALAFGGARIVLNTMHYAEIRGVNARLFEGTACGGFVLSHAGPEVDKYFKPGTEIATFDSQAELADAIHHYLRADDERRSIAEAGQARAHLDHTYHQRLGQLLRTVGLYERLCAPK